MQLDAIQYQNVSSAGFHTFRPCGNGFWTCIIAHGSVCFECDGTERKMTGSHMVLYEPGARQNIYSTGADYLHDWFHLKMEDTDRAFFQPLGIPVNVPVPLVNLAPLSGLIRLAAMEFEAHGIHSADACDHLIHAFFLKAADLIREASFSVPPERHYAAMSALRDEIISFPYRTWTLAEAVQRTGLSESYFQHTYRRLMGRPFTDEVIESRIRYAKALLRRSGDTIARIAALCGYASEFHFMRQFKKRTGLTPTAWRQSQRE